MKLHPEWMNYTLPWTIIGNCFVRVKESSAGCWEHRRWECVNSLKFRNRLPFEMKNIWFPCILLLESRVRKTDTFTSCGGKGLYHVFPASQRSILMTRQFSKTNNLEMCVDIITIPGKVKGRVVNSRRYTKRFCK